MSRDQTNEETARSRMNSQMPVSKKVAFADDVLDNSGPMAGLEEKVDLLIHRLAREVAWTWRLEWIVPPIAIAFASWTLLVRRLRRRMKAKSD